MSHEALEHKNTTETDQEQGEDLLASFMERIREQNPTSGSKLKDLFDKEGNSDAFNDALDDLAFDIAFEDPGYEVNARRLRELERSKDRRHKQEAASIAERQRDVVKQIKQLIQLEAGISTEETRDDIEKGRAAVAERLDGMDATKATPEDILRKLGILTGSEKDDQEGEVFTYPEDLFPESVNLKWNVYIATVQKHLDIVEKVRKDEVDRHEIVDVDAYRRSAHNAVAEDLHKILGFSNLSEKEWNFESTRRLVAKMRETKFVGKSTGETRLTGELLARGFGLHVLAKLGEKPKH